MDRLLEFIELLTPAEQAIAIIIAGLIGIAILSHFYQLIKVEDINNYPTLGIDMESVMDTLDRTNSLLEMSHLMAYTPEKLNSLLWPDGDASDLANGQEDFIVVLPEVKGNFDQNMKCLEKTGIIKPTPEGYLYWEPTKDDFDVKEALGLRTVVKDIKESYA